jgi:hypothetical protein
VIAELPGDLFDGQTLAAEGDDAFVFLLCHRKTNCSATPAAPQPQGADPNGGLE